MKAKRKVLLVRTSYLEDHMGYMFAPPIGVLTLAAIARRDRPDEWDVRVLDTAPVKAGPDTVARIIREYAPHVVGISSLSLEAHNLHRIAAVAKRLNPETKVIIGGPHATSFYDQTLKDANVDYAVIGEGEETFLELLDRLHDGADAADVPGAACMRDGEVHYGGARLFREDLDSLPMPAWDMLDLKPYSRATSMNGMLARKPYAGLFSSRACPYKCVYCHGIFGKKFRAQSPERTLEEIELLTGKYGVRELHIYDDVFNFDRDRVFAIMEGVLSRGIDVKFAFPNGVRGDIMTRDVVKAMARAGAYCITYAVETASPRIQKLIRKNLNLDKVREVAEWTFDAGVIPAGFFMLGFPTETREEMEQTIQFARKSKMLVANFFCVTPFPRTGLYELAKKQYPDHDFGYDFSPKMHYWTEKPYYTEVSGIDVMATRGHALRSFYLNPWRVWNAMRLFPKNLTYLQPVYDAITYWLVGRGRETDTSINIAHTEA